MRHVTVLSGSALLLLAVACGADEPASASAPSGVTTRTPVAGSPPPVATAASAATALPSPGRAHLDWGEAFCAVTADFDEAIGAVQDDLDPRALSVDERRERGIHRYAAYIEAAEIALERMQQIDPPADAGAYHRAVLSQLGELSRLFADQIGRMEAAGSHEEIDVAVADLQADVDRIENSVWMAAGMLSSEAERALADALRCGVLVG